MSRISSLALSVLLLGITVAVWADSDTRPTTEVEKLFSTQVLTVLSQALPQPLPGFEVDQIDEVEPYEQIAPGCEAQPFAVFYSSTWINAEQIEKERAQEEEAISRAVDKLKNDPMEKEHSALMAKQEQLIEEFGKAMETGDTAMVDALQKEMETLSAQMEKIGQSQEAVLKEATHSLSNKSRLAIRMIANYFDADEPADTVTELKPVFGHLAYAYHDNQGKFEDRTTVLVGPWKKRTENEQAYYSATPKSSLPYTQVQTVTVTVSGDPELTRKVIEGIDWKALAALVE